MEAASSHDVSAARPRFGPCLARRSGFRDQSRTGFAGPARCRGRDRLHSDSRRVACRFCAPCQTTLMSVVTLVTIANRTCGYGLSGGLLLFHYALRCVREHECCPFRRCGRGKVAATRPPARIHHAGLERHRHGRSDPLCDRHKSRELTADQLASLQKLATQVIALIEHRRAGRSQERFRRAIFDVRYRVGTAAVVTLIVGLLITALAMFGVERSRRNAISDRLDHLAERISTEVSRRVNLPLYGMKGARGVYAASKSVERGEFRAYVASRNLGSEFPGVTGSFPSNARRSGDGRVERRLRGHRDEQRIMRARDSSCNQQRLRRRNSLGLVHLTPLEVAAAAVSPGWR